VGRPRCWCWGWWRCCWWGVGVLFGFGQALGAKGRHQRAADLAAVSAATKMRDDYPRLFEPVVLANGLPNPRHLPTVAVSGKGRERIGVRARAAAELSPSTGAGLDFPAQASVGGYDGSLAYRMGKPMHPDVAQAFDAMARAAARDGLALSITSAFRSDAEQARLFAANPNPKWVAPPGTSLHRWATELDLGPPGAYPWLAANARRFGFIHRYAWEAWHYETPLALYTCAFALPWPRQGGRYREGGAA